MKIINDVYLSDMLADIAKAHFDKKNSENIKEALVMFAGYTKHKDDYEEMLYSQPNWADNYSVAEMDMAKAICNEVGDIYLSKWDIPSAYMKAMYCVPISEKLNNTEWLLCYAIEIKGKHALLQVQVDKAGAWNYSLNTKDLTFEGEGELDVYDYYSHKLELTTA